MKKVVDECDNDMRDNLSIALEKFANKEELQQPLKDIIQEFGRNLLDIDCPDEILSKFKFFGLTSAFKKFQTNEELAAYEEKAVIAFVEKFTTANIM